MKFKEQRGNVFVFEDEDGWEVEAKCLRKSSGYFALEFDSVMVWSDMDVELLGGAEHYSVIQTAAQMMQILIDRGLV